MSRKTIVAMLLCASLSFSLCATAFAEGLDTPEIIWHESMAGQTITPAVTPAQQTQDSTPAETATPVPQATEANEAPATQEPESSATPDATAETTTPEPAEATATPESSLEPADSATATPAPAQPQRSVLIHMDVPSGLQLGDSVTLSATLIGYDDVSVSLQWQYSHDGEHWTDAQGTGSNEMDYTFQVSDETAGTIWRLAVTIL